MTAPDVETIIALTFVAVVDDPARFRSSEVVGAHFELTPKKYRSGEIDTTRRVSKISDFSIRTVAGGHGPIPDRSKTPATGSAKRVAAVRPLCVCGVE